MSKETPKETMPVLERDDKGRFLPGHPGGGVLQPRGVGGRRKALERLDVIFARTEVLDELEDALLKDFHKNPVKFFKTILMPLMPQNVKVEMQAQGQVVWTRLKDMFPPGAPASAPAPAGEVLEGEAVEVPGD